MAIPWPENASAFIFGRARSMLKRSAVPLIGNGMASSDRRESRLFGAALDDHRNPVHRLAAI
jgi:hypothetical protein